MIHPQVLDRAAFATDACDDFIDPVVAFRCVLYDFAGGIGWRQDSVFDGFGFAHAAEDLAAVKWITDDQRLVRNEMPAPFPVQWGYF